MNEKWNAEMSRVNKYSTLLLWQTKISSGVKMCSTSHINCMDSLCAIIVFNMIFKRLPHLCTPHIQLSLSRAVNFKTQIQPQRPGRFSNSYLQWLQQILIYNDCLHRPNPDDAGPIVHRPMGLPITPGCDTAWIRTRVSVVTPLALRCSALDRCAIREITEDGSTL